MWELRPFSAGSMEQSSEEETEKEKEKDKEKERPSTAGPGTRLTEINKILKSGRVDKRRRRRQEQDVVEQEEMDWQMKKRKREAIAGRFWARIDRSKSKDSVFDDDSDSDGFLTSRPSEATKKTAGYDNLEDLFKDEVGLGDQVLESRPVNLDCPSESDEDELDFEAISIDKVKLRRVGTSITLSHFFNCTTRNSVTGRIVMKEDRYIPGFVLVDLFGRRRLIGNPEQIMEDHYIFRPHVMSHRSWIYHKFAKDPRKLAQVNGKDSMNGMIKKILSLECIDVDVNTGRHSPLFAWMISSGFLSCTGDGALVTMMLVTSFFMCIITYSLNTPERYNYIRVMLLPLRIAVCIGIVLQTNNLTHYISVIVFSALSILVLIIDFIFGDLFLIWAYRFQCSYKVLDQLPERVFLCSRQGAAHLDDVLGQRLGITTEVIGCAWDSRYSLIADLGGLICELRRPRLPELYALLQEFQENQEDYGFLSVKCFSTDRPNFDSLEQDIPIRDLNRIIENHRRNHPWTWKMVSKRDMKFPEKKGVEILEMKKQLMKDG